MIKMILTDLDHTLLRQDGGVSDETLRVLAQCREKGVRFAIATARYWIGAERCIRLLRPDYEITTDGTLIHAKDQCLYSRAFSAEETNAIIQAIARMVTGAEITAACGKTVYWNSLRIAESDRLYKAVYCDFSSPMGLQANKIAAELPSPSAAQAIAEKFPCKSMSYRGENWYAFIPADAGKIAAIKALTEISEIGLDEVVAFGDDMNDIDMLNICGKGVAVANALPEVRQIADEITASNDEDGVALWLKENVL